MAGVDAVCAASGVCAGVGVSADSGEVGRHDDQCTFKTCYLFGWTWLKRVKVSLLGRNRRRLSRWIDGEIRAFVSPLSWLSDDSRTSGGSGFVVPLVR